MGENPPQGVPDTGFIPQYQSDSEAPTGTLYYNSSDGLKKYKDPAGTVHVDATTPVPNSSLANDSVTVAGNSVSLGGSTPVNFTDLGDNGTGEVLNTDLANATVSVAGKSVSLGNAIAIAFSDLSDNGTGEVSNADLANATLTVAGNTISLGGSSPISFTDLSDTGTGEVSNADLANATVTVAGKSVTLGNAISVAFSDLSDTGTGEVGNTDLANNSVTVNAGSNLTGGGSIPLGGSTTLNASGGNVPNWQEDGNSPITPSSTNSLTYSLSGSYSIIEVKAAWFSYSGPGGYIQLRLNNTSKSNYYFKDITGTSHSATSQIDVTSSDDSNGGNTFQFLISGKSPANSFGYAGEPMTAHGNSAALVGALSASSTTSPITSISLFTSDSSNFSGKVHVYGWNA